MQSNSKLTSEQKRDRKEMLESVYIGEIVYIANNGETTIVYCRVGSNITFATSIMSPNEKKFRRKVGEYHALTRYINGETVMLPDGEFYSVLDSGMYTLPFIK